MTEMPAAPQQLPYPVDIRFPLAFSAFRSFLPMEGQDAEGRTVLEGRSLLYPPASRDYAPCPYPDSRHDHEKPMNAGALQYLTGNIEAAAAYFESLARHVRTRTFAAPPSTWSSVEDGALTHLLRTGYTGFRAPQMWLVNSLLGKLHSLPPCVSIISKLSLGLIDLTFSAALPDTPPFPEQADGNILYRFAEEQAKLIGRDEVCAGPPHLIRRFLQLGVSPSATGAEGPDLKLEFDETHILDYGALIWAGEMCAILYNWIRLSLIRAEEGELDPRAHLRISFPYALVVFQAVDTDQSFANTILSTYVDRLWGTPHSRETTHWMQSLCGQLDSLLCEPPSRISLSAGDWEDICRSFAEAFCRIGRALDALEVLAPTSGPVTPHELEMLFGPMPRQTGHDGGVRRSCPA